jgi:hypothetical protein
MWLQHPEFPERYRPDRIGCVATDHGNAVVFVDQAFKGAANRYDADALISALTDCGYKVLVFWKNGEEREHRLRYNRRLYPTPPTTEEIWDSDPEYTKLGQDVAYFERTGQSPCLWVPEQPLQGITTPAAATLVGDEV